MYAMQNKMISKKNNLYLFSSIVILSLLIGIIGPVTMIAQTDLISKVEKVVNGQLSFHDLYIPFILNFGLMVSTNLSLIYDYLNLKIDNIVELLNVNKIKYILQRISFIAFEDPEVYDKFKYLGDNNVYALKLDLILNMLSFGISTLFYIVILSQYSWVLPVVIFIFVPVTAYFTSKYAREFYRKQYSFTADERAARYKSEILRKREYAKEVRLYNSGKFILADWEKKIKTYNHLFLNNLLKYTFISKGISLSQFVVVFLNLSFVLYLLYNGNISVAVFVVLSNQVLRINVIDTTTKIANAIMKIKHVKRITNELSGYEEQKEEKAYTFGNDIEIEFRDVYFSYPNSEEPVLKGVSFKIHSGESYVLVGDNGAGKSTLIKLLLGLYKPAQGTILINKVDIKYIPNKALMKILGCTFQDYAQYALSIKENIGFDMDMEEMKRKTEFLEIDRIAENFERKYDTLLGKIYGESVDISGGQWQRIAIARAFANRKKVMIFDEPTAALDPIAEIETFESILENCRGSLVLFVTHRLGISTKVDKILVLDKGIVSEYGNFECLMEAKGKFYYLFENQRQFYVKKEITHG